MSLITVRVSGAGDFDPLSFQRQTVVAYGAVAQALRERAAQHPVRFWNFIPDINKPISESLSRYMVFNAGRYAAFQDWFGADSSFRREIATASGVGHTGKDLVVHCLSSSTRGVAIENPRQVSSYHYSARYGPLPPTFARATVMNRASADDAILLVGGTASIRGEHSLHPGDLIQQTMETLHNLAAVVHTKWIAGGGEDFGRNDCDLAWLRHFRCLRVYYVRSEDRATIAGILADQRLDVEEIEWIQANLCRTELLVEFEGVAHQPQVGVAEQETISISRQRAALEGCASHSKARRGC